MHRPDCRRTAAIRTTNLLFVTCQHYESVLRRMASAQRPWALFSSMEPWLRQDTGAFQRRSVLTRSAPLRDDTSRRRQNVLVTCREFVCCWQQGDTTSGVYQCSDRTKRSTIHGRCSSEGICGSCHHHIGNTIKIALTDITLHACTRIYANRHHSTYSLNRFIHVLVCITF